MQAVSWAEAEDTPVTVYCTNSSIAPAKAGRIELRTILPYDVYRRADSVMGKKLTQDQYMFFKDLYSPCTILHVFDRVDMWFARGYTDVHLHEAGESSYVASSKGICGEDDPHTVAHLHLTEDPGVNSARCSVCRLFHKGGHDRAAKLLNVEPEPNPVVPTVLYIHNEPDTARYTKEEIDKIHADVGELLADIISEGYEVWVKDHHKRGGRCDFSMADRMVQSPPELLDTSKYALVISVRSKCVEGLANGFNGVTRDAVTKCAKGFAHVYERGIAKVRKHLGLE